MQVFLGRIGRDTSQYQFLEDVLQLDLLFGGQLVSFEDQASYDLHKVLISPVLFVVEHKQQLLNCHFYVIAPEWKLVCDPAEEFEEAAFEWEAEVQQFLYFAAVFEKYLRVALYQEVCKLFENLLQITQQVTLLARQLSYQETSNRQHCLNAGVEVGPAGILQKAAYNLA